MMCVVQFLLGPMRAGPSPARAAPDARNADPGPGAQAESRFRLPRLPRNAGRGTRFGARAPGKQ
eukprot:11681642-Alexandrium_andersonii.AAC.1